MRNWEDRKGKSVYVANCELQQVKYHKIVLAVGSEGDISVGSVS